MQSNTRAKSESTVESSQGYVFSVIPSYWSYLEFEVVETARLVQVKSVFDMSKMKLKNSVGVGG